MLAFWGKTTLRTSQSICADSTLSFAVASLILVALLFMNSNIAQEFWVYLRLLARDEDEALADALQLH